MSLCRNASSGRVVLFVVLLALVIGLSTNGLAQSEPAPKVELFVGYQWLNPGITVPVPGRSPNNAIGFKLPDMSDGWAINGAYNFTEHWGLEGDWGASYGGRAAHNTISVGPRFVWRTEGVNFFAHTLLGLNRLTPTGLDGNSGIGAILGGGIDLKVWKPLSIRLFEADYVWANHNFADSASAAFPDLRRPRESGAQLRAGLVFNFGYPNAAPPTATCSIQPSEVMVGEPVTATVAGANFNPKHTLTYAWSSTGGKVTGKDTTASIDTNGVAGGSYVVTAHVSDAKMKKGGEASCTANFTVKEPPKNPPTMSCSASPASVQSGTDSTVSCSCSSPDGVPVTVSGWTASGGTLNGNGNSATLSTNGAPAGAINVSATCTDSRGLTGQASTQVNVEVPPPPPPVASKLSECDFPNKVKPWRVDNTCKAVLDDVAKNLQQNADSSLVIVGNADPSEKRKNLAAERAVNSKAYLSGGEAKQGIDPSRISVRTGSAGTTTAEYWVVPSGATFTGEGTTPVDENKVQPVPDHPAKKPAKKMAKPM